MRYLLDTNIISNVTKPVPSAPLLDWMAAQDDADLYLSTVTIAELQKGILDLPDGRRRQELENWFAGSTGPQAIFAGRIFSFDEQAALIWGRLMSEGRKAGKPRSPIDMMVAAIAVANQCTIVTDNDKDFQGLPTFNPMRPDSTT
ncbi:MAG: type II toxin-antitoxin system VapC family toxin [Lautropia sp.]|nr:type II toxin-antitoxin system VapC family toxin [Lautropia sp.]